LGEFLERVDTRNVVGDQNVLTISAEHGLISQEEFFNRRVASENVAGYYRLVIGDFAYNKSYSRGYPMGAIRRLDRYPSGVVSPLYICFRLSVGAPVDSDFLAHYFDGGAIDTQLADVAKEGARNHGLLNVSVKEFFEIETALPPIEEQRCVAQILDTLDTAIREAEALIDKLKAVKQGLLHDLLTRGIDANGQLRPPQSEAPQLYKKSPLGWFPREWVLRELGDLAEVSRGKFTHRPRNDPAFFGGKYPFIQTGDVAVAQGGYISTYSQTLSARGIAVSQDFPAGTIAITIAANIADTAILARPMFFPDSVVGAVVYPEHNIRFVELSIRRAKRSLDARAPQSAQKNINLQDLRPLLLAVPSKSEQDAIAARYDAIQAQLEAEQIAVTKLRQQKNGLMDDLLTGRVRVTPLLQPVQQPAAQMGA